MSTVSDQILTQNPIVNRLRTTTLTPALPGQILVDRLGSTVPSRKPTWKNILVLTSAMTAIVAGVGFYRPRAAANSATMHESSAETPVGVTITRPTPASTSNVVLPATMRPWQRATLHSRVSGYLTAWHRDLGSSVKAGELLAEIEAPELDQELAEGEALTSEAEAAAVQAEAERIEAQADLKVAEAQLDRVRAEYNLAESQRVRREKLLQNLAVSQEEVDTFQRQSEARAADVAAAEADLARRRTNLDTRAAIITARQATAKSRRANVDRLNELQGFKRIVAPFDGVVTSRLAEVGMLVTAGKESLFVVEDLSRIRVQINVPQTYAMQMVPGVMGTVSLPESPTHPVPGEITRIAESVDPASRAMLAEIELDNTAHRFQPGSYAQVSLATPQNSTAWTIPTNTISMRTNGPHVVLVDDQGQIEIRRVTLGRDLGNRVIVAEGIRGGERLVINPGDELATGVLVEIRQESPSTPKVVQRSK